MSYALDKLDAYLRRQEEHERSLIQEPNPHKLYNGEHCTSCEEHEIEAEKFWAWRMALEAIREMAGK